MHCITMGYTTPPQKYWNYTKNKCSRGSWSLDFGEKGYKIFGLEDILLIIDGYFYIGRVRMITVFPWQFLVVTQTYHYNTEY